MALLAQVPLKFDAKDDPSKQNEVGGTAAIDIITLKALGPGAPLRYGNVIPGTERVQLDNRMLSEKLEK